MPLKEGAVLAKVWLPPAAPESSAERLQEHVQGDMTDTLPVSCTWELPSLATPDPAGSLISVGAEKNSPPLQLWRGSF